MRLSSAIIWPATLTAWRHEPEEAEMEQSAMT